MSPKAFRKLGPSGRPYGPSYYLLDPDHVTLIDLWNRLRGRDQRAVVNAMQILVAGQQKVAAPKKAARRRQVSR